MEPNIYDELVRKAQEDGIERYVVGAIIGDSNKILILQRPKEEFMGGIYELPSGKVERGETLQEALYREVKEETNLTIREIKRYLSHFDYNSGSGKRTRQFNFVVQVHSPLEVSLTEHDYYAWVSRHEMNNYSLTDSIKTVLEEYWKR